MTPRPDCRVCGINRPLTWEDSQPMWLRRLAQEMQPDWQAPPRTKVRICRACNGTLGKLFQEPVAPIVRRMFVAGSAQLDTTEQARLAAWMEQTSALNVVADERSQELYHASTIERLRQNLLEMMQTGMPTALSTVRVQALALGDDQVSCPTLSRPRQIDPEVATGFGLDWSLSVRSAGPMLWELVVAPNAEAATWYRGQTSGDEWLQMIWPATDVVQWPSFRLHPDDVDDVELAVGLNPARRRRRRAVPPVDD